jgi:hypothetical protein
MKIRPYNKKNVDSEYSLLNKILDRLRSSAMYKDSLKINTMMEMMEDYWKGQVNLPSSEGEPGSETNIVQGIIESQVSSLVDGDVDISVEVEEPADEPYTEDASIQLTDIWKSNDMVEKLDENERERLKFGTCFWKIYPEDEDVKIDTASIDTVFPDPKVTDIYKIQEGDFFIQVMPKPLSFFRRKFQERGKQVKGSRDYSIHGVKFIGEADGYGDDVVYDQDNLIEYWEKDDDGVLRLVYCTEDLILYDSFWESEESYFEHGQFPFVGMVCYKVKGRLWGMGDVEGLIPVQNIINTLDDQIIMNAQLTANGQHLVGKGAGVVLSTWTNQPGLKIPANDIEKIKPVEVPMLPAYILARRDRAFDESEVVSGRSDVLEGRRGGSLRAASAIIALQEAGSRRANHKQMMLSKGLGRVGKMALELKMEIQSVPKPYKFQEEDNIKYKWLNAQDLREIPYMIPADESGKMKALTENVTNPDTGETVEQAITRPFKFRVNVNVGSGLPNNKSFIYQATLELFKYGILTLPEARKILKKVLDFPVFDPTNPDGQFAGAGAQATGQGLLDELAGKVADAGIMRGQSQQQADIQSQQAEQDAQNQQLSQLLGMLPPDLQGLINGSRGAGNA